MTSRRFSFFERNIPGHIEFFEKSIRIGADKAAAAGFKVKAYRNY